MLVGFPLAFFPYRHDCMSLFYFSSFTLHIGVNTDATLGLEWEIEFFFNRRGVS